MNDPTHVSESIASAVSAADAAEGAAGQAAPRGRMAVFLDSDLLHSFLRSKLVMVAAALTAADLRRRVPGAAHRAA